MNWQEDLKDTLGIKKVIPMITISSIVTGQTDYIKLEGGKVYRQYQEDNYNTWVRVFFIVYIGRNIIKTSKKSFRLLDNDQTIVVLPSDINSMKQFAQYWDDSATHIVKVQDFKLK